MAKGATYSRRQRRSEFRTAGFLKIKNMYGRLSPQGIAWYQKMQEDGKNYSEQYKKYVLDSIEEQLELRLKGNFDEETGKGFYGLRNTWSDLGYNEDEISKLEEAWLLTTVKSDSYREDKKQARTLRKEAQQSRAARINAAG